jgi:hypothetical protein
MADAGGRRPHREDRKGKIDDRTAACGKAPQEERAAKLQTTPTAATTTGQRRCNDTNPTKTAVMKYFIRSLKYFVALCVLCAAIMALNRLSGFATLTLEETFYVMFHTMRGMMLPAVIVLLAAFYPKFGFVQRKVEGDVGENREQIVNAFKSAGFSLRTDEDGVMTFRADGLLRKLTLLGEDEIKVSQYGQWILLDGIRRGVARAGYKLDSYIQMAKHD